MNKKIFYLRHLSILKTIRINYQYFPLSVALKFPIIISRNVYLKKLKGKILIGPTIKTGQIQIGFMETSLTSGSEQCILNFEGVIIFKGKAKFGAGTKIAVGNEARLTFGENFKITSNSSIACFKEIIFGSNCLLSWEILVMDTDAHHIYNSDEEIINPDKVITIGEKVWIGCRVTILKGAEIPNYCIVGSNSVVSKSFNDANSLIAGNPAKIIKREISW